MKLHTMQDILMQFDINWKANFRDLSPKNCHVIIAISGGIDSVVLTDILYKKSFDFTLAHVNFQLRGEESTRDEHFVKTLGNNYNKPVLVKTFETATFAVNEKISIQEAARNLRYAWFAELIKSQTAILGKPVYVATAHHADDNAETALFNFLRGTGVKGLTGIPVVDLKRKIIRPLLFTTKKSIYTYAENSGLQWVQDSSNSSNKYTRNFIRHQIIPLAETVFPEVINNLLQNIKRFTDTEIIYQNAIEIYKKKLITHKPNEIHIPILKLLKTPAFETVLLEIIRTFNFTSSQLQEITKLLHANNAAQIASPSHRIIKNRKWLIIAPLQTEISEHIIIEKEDVSIPFAHGLLQIKHIQSANYDISKKKNIASLDASKIKFPLLLRRWQPGDYFYPLGMQKKKKLSRFFKDQKLSKTEKENAWVLISDSKIIWIIDYRIDDRIKINPTTKEIIEFNYQKYKSEYVLQNL